MAEGYKPVRHVREEEFIAEAIKSTRRGVRDVQRPTGTEKARTTERVEEVAVESGQAKSAADAAATAAALAKTTADGRNRIYAQMVEPVTLPELPFVNGDLWYQLDVEGRIAEVRIWNGSTWGPFQLVAGSLLVPGSVGNVLIADGAIDGMTITGALIRTAPSGQRLQLDVSGLSAFDATGNVTSEIRSGSGGMDLSGILRVQDAFNSVPRTVIQKSGVTAEDGSMVGGVRSLRSFIDPGQLYAEYRTAPLAEGGTYGSGRVWAQTYSGRSSLTVEGRPPSVSTPAPNARAILESGDGTASLLLSNGVDTTVILEASNNELYIRQEAVRFEFPVTFQGDTDWASVSTPGATGVCRWRQLNGMIVFEYNLTFSPAIAGGATIIAATLPTAARPSVDAPVHAMAAGLFPAYARVTPSGALQIRNPNTGAAGALFGNGNWPASS